MPSVIPNPTVLATTIDRTASQHTAILQVPPSRLPINDRTASEHASILQVSPPRLPLLPPVLADDGLQCSFFPSPPPPAVRQRAASAGPVVQGVLNLLARRHVQAVDVTTGMMRVAPRICEFYHAFMDTHNCYFQPAVTS